MQRADGCSGRRWSVGRSSPLGTQLEFASSLGRLVSHAARLHMMRSQHSQRSSRSTDCRAVLLADAIVELWSVRWHSCWPSAPDTRKAAVDRGSTSDRPRYDAHAERWTPPLPLASATQRRARRSWWSHNANLLLLPLIDTRHSRYLCSTRIYVLTFDHDLWPWLSVPPAMTRKHTQNSK